MRIPISLLAPSLPTLMALANAVATSGSDFLMNYRTQSIRIVKYGRQGEIVVNGKTYNNLMEPLGLEDDEIADVMNYIMNSWENTQDKMVTPEEVTAVEK